MATKQSTLKAVGELSICVVISSFLAQGNQLFTVTPHKHSACAPISSTKCQSLWRNSSQLIYTLILFAPRFYLCFPIMGKSRTSRTPLSLLLSLDPVVLPLPPLPPRPGREPASPPPRRRAEAWRRFLGAALSCFFVFWSANRGWDMKSM